MESAKAQKANVVALRPSGLTIRRESVADVLLDLGPLIRRHDREIFAGRNWGPLKLDIVRYLDLEMRGMLLVIAVRAGTRLVGYSIDIIAPAIHYATTLVAQNDAVFIHPDYRKGKGLSYKKLPGYQLLAFREQMLDELKIPRRLISVSMQRLFGNVLQKLGYHVETLIFHKAH